jgi:CRP-like cAMP-binding protein
MNQTELHESGIKALRALNGTIATSRLYPPTAPQVTNAVEHGYKGLHHFLKQHGKLEISLRDREPFLGDLPVAEETLASFPNLIVYRQMEILGVNRLVIPSSMDMFAYGQILSVFNAKPDKIEKDGGGIEFITGLGLISYFPESDPVEVSVGSDTSIDGPSPQNRLKVEKELLACLFGKDNRSAVKERLKKNFENVDETVNLFVAAIGHILRDLQKKTGVSRSELFPHILNTGGELIAREDHNRAILELGRVLVTSLKEPALCVILSQDYPDGFGKRLYDAQITLLDKDIFENIIVIFRDQLAKIKLREGSESFHSKFVEDALLRLMDTEKGKHYLGTEKARTVLQKGEKERKKQRIEAGIRGIAQGDFTYLQSEELLEQLPRVVRRMVTTDGLHFDAFLKKLVNQIYTGGKDPQFLEMLTSVTENFISDHQWHYVDVLLSPLLDWVRETENSDEPFERVVSLLQVAMQHCWNDGKKSQGDTILVLFHQIRTGELKKDSKIETIVGRIQDRGIQRASFPELLDKWLLAPHIEEFSSRLILQGPVALRFLVESLIVAENSDHRLKILDLLTTNAWFVPDIIHERLQEHMEWYGTRNLIKLLAETGGKKDAEAVLPYLNHEDFRVQRGAYICINKIGGENRKRLFLAALDSSSELIKIQVIRALVTFCDHEMVSRLAKLLGEYEGFSEENRDALLIQLFDTLGKCPCPAAVKAVAGFLKMRNHRATRRLSVQVWTAAEKAMQLLEQDQQKLRKMHVQASQLRKNAIRQAVKRGTTSPALRVVSGLVEEQTIRMLLNKGEEGKARKQLVDLIEQTVKTRNFVQADKLKEWLIDINEAALGDIIRAAEIISDTKSATIDKTHLDIWCDLYEFLTTEEFSSVYHSLQHKKYVNEEIVVYQGALQTALYFINSGKVKLFYQDKGDRVLVKTMGKGEIIGTGSFFDASVWTISVASVGTTDLSILRLEKMQRWRDELPGLESKLSDFCTRFESIGNIIKKSSRDRRTHERHRIAGRVSTLLLDNSGQTTGVNAEAELFDISEGGVSYLLEMLRKENGRLILGRKVKVMLPGGKKPGQQIGIVGDILAVREIPEREGDCSVHVKFETAVSSSQLKEILMAGQRDSQMSR